MADQYRCTTCGHDSHKWFGRCPECASWSTATIPAASSSGALASLTLGDAPADPPRTVTGIGELDRVLGGGFVPGSVALLAGEPGIGKSTLVLQLLHAVASSGHDVLLVSGEESVGQIAGRGARLGIEGGTIRVATSSSLEAVMAEIASRVPRLVVIDSIQTIADESLDQPAGSMVQVRESAAALTEHAKRTGVSFVLVGHVTKDGTVAGPKTLEHVVDVVLSLEGDRTGALRLLRANKNRFGATDETGVFVMSSKGLDPVGDPSALFLADRREGVPGSVVFPSIEGSRPVLVEIQALVAEGTPQQLRRVAIGLEQRRLSLLTAIATQRARLSLAGQDVFVAVAGGLVVREPAADLAVCLALFSAVTDSPLDERAVAIGEVGLSGEVRRVPAMVRRLAEARRLGFTSAYVPYSFDEHIEGLRPIRVPDLAAAFHHARAITRV